MFLSAWQDYKKNVYLILEQLKKFSEVLRITIVALHKDGRGYNKFGNSLELSYITVARVIQRFSQDGFHSEQASQGSIKEVESLCCVSGAEAGLKKQTLECCQHCFRGCRSRRSACQGSDHMSHCLQQVSLDGRHLCMCAAGTGELRFIEGNMDSNIYSGAKKYLVSHQLCKFSHLKRWERPVILIIGIPQLWETK